MCVGIARGAAHHGELLQGVFEDENGLLRRALVTLPCPAFQSEATFHVSANGDRTITVAPGGRTKTEQALELTRRWYAPSRPGGHVTLLSDIPIGIGMGSSTSDIVAAVRALMNGYRLHLRPTDLARIAVVAETASDSTMLDNVVALFAHRDGRVLEVFGDSLPPLVVVGCDTDPTGAGVDTVALPPASYDVDEVATFRVLRGLLRRAVADADPELLARVAESSARINQRHVPTRRLDEVRRVGVRTGALGVQVAHSGTVAGLLYAGDDPGAADRAQAALAMLAAAGVERRWCYHLGDVTAWAS